MTVQPKKAVGYIRTSKEEQAISPLVQRDKIGQWCADNGVELLEIHSDISVSGGAEIDKRAGMRNAVEAAKLHGASYLVVARRDRLARDTLISAVAERVFLDIGAKIISADGAGNGDSPEDILMRQILDSFSQYERAIIRFRIKSALGRLQKEGRRTGGLPYGYGVAGDDDTTLVPDEHEQSVCKKIIELRAGGETIWGICTALTRAGVEPRAARWQHATIKAVLQREAPELEERIRDDYERIKSGAVLH